MAKISKIKLPNNSEYDIYDPNAAHGTYAGSSTDGGPAATAKKLFGQDTRLANNPPSFYLTSGQNSTLITEFKSRGVIDAPGSSGFGTLITITPWMDNSGGLPVQIYVDNTGQRAIRFAQTDATWGSWSTLALTSDIPSVGNGTIKLQRNGVDVLSFTTNQNGNVTGNLIVPTKVSELTNDSGYLTAHQDISGKYDKITQLGIKGCAGSGQYWYFKIATLTIAQGYINGPIAFELSQREHEVTMIQVSFRSISGTDPELGYFVTNQRNNYWIIKDTTSTWSIYGKYNEIWGACALHRIVGFRVNNGVTVTVNMENVSAIPSGATQAVYGGNCAFATSAGNASTVNNLTVQTAVPADAKFTDTTYTFATGDSNGQIKVTPSGGTAQNVSVKGLGSAAYTNSGTYATQTVLTNQNLNSLTVAGFYNAGDGNSVTNKPSGVDAFGLEVIHTAGGTYYVQLLYKNGDVVPYRRYCNNGTWTSWAKDESVTYTSSVNAVVGDTTCTISDSSITTTSLIEPFSSNSTGDTIAIKNIAVTAGQAVLTFKALTVDTSFRLRVTNV